MASAVLHRTTFSQTLRWVSKSRSTGLLSFRRQLCDKVSGPDSGDGSESTVSHSDYVPNRVRKRLAAKGLSLDMLQSESDRQIETHDGPKLHDLLKESLIEKPPQEFPSDYSFTQNVKKVSEPVKRNISPEKTSVLLFPGQGSQFVGMGKGLLKYPGVEELYDRASAVLGYDLLQICLNGPYEKLTKTVYCQPAVFVTSVAALERLKEEFPAAAESIVAAAGYSVGEFAALVASGVMTFDDGIEAIKLRAIAMDTAAKQRNGGMLTVFIEPETKLRTAVVAAKDYCRDKFKMEDPVCSIAAYLSCGVRVVAGHEETLAFIQKYGREFGIRRTKMLAVSGAFHTDLMNIRSRQQWDFDDALEKMTYNVPKFPVYLNFEGKQ